MNSAIRAIVRGAIKRDVAVYGIEDGYTGLLAPHIRQLRSHDVAGLTGRAGTMLGSAREPRMLLPEWQQRAVDILGQRHIDGLIVIGGSGSQQGAKALSQLGFPVVGIPSTIDNDLPFTDMSLGVDTAVNTAVECVDMIKETMTSHRRVAVVEVMGRDSGFLAEQVALATGAEAVVVPERPMSKEALREIAFQRMVRQHGHYTLIVVAEGVTSPSSADITSYLSGLGFSVRLEVLGHLQRGGKPTAYDRILGARMGIAAVSALLEGVHDVYLTVRGNAIQHEPYASVTRTQVKVTEEMLDLIQQLS